MKNPVLIKTQMLMLIMLFLSILGLNIRLSDVVFAQQASSVSTQVIPKNGLLTTTINLDTKPGNSKAAAAYDTSRVIVRFRNGTDFLPSSGKVISLLPTQNVHLVTNPPGLSVKEVIAQYKNNPNVIYVEPDYIVNAIATPNDYYYSTMPMQWDMAKINAPSAWDTSTDASNMVVAIVDTGIDFNHADLQANLYKGTGTSVIGYTCMNGSCVLGGQDDHGHGTHVAGTIGAVTNNSNGVAGINWKIQLLPIKFLSSSGSGSISDAVLGYKQLLSLKSSGVNIGVTNNSWGGGGYSQALKDAMAALEATGVINVCAAGNSSVNADTSPMYPGAYDNRGIVSVLATDSNDLGASFTNYGIASVDIGAPGVGIFSTAASGTCSLCDASGYKSLSGTSMASPHVAGVAAMFLSRNSTWVSNYTKTLIAAKTRDVLLDPSSYDSLTDTKAKTTSTGGRLNYAKVLNNSAALTSPLNNFPTVTVGPDVFASAGQTVNFDQKYSDPDSADVNTLRTGIGRGSMSSFTAWLFGWQASRLFPSSVPFNAPSVARVAAMPYDISVTDNRGGGASARNWAVVNASSSGSAPIGNLTVLPSGTVNTPVTIGYSAKSGTIIAWDLNVSRGGGSSGVCCYTGTAASWTPTAAGTYRITVQGIDAQLNTTAVSTAEITIDTASNIPPVSVTKVSQNSGAAPLSISVDASASSDPDGTIQTYYFDCGLGYATGQSTSLGSCNFTQPGTYWVRALVSDNSGNLGVSADYVVVTPPGGTPTDTTPPTVSILSPASGTTVSGTVTLTANASDNVGVKDVTFYLDTNTSLGVATYNSTSNTYSLQWNTSALAAGTSHNIDAVAQDAAGNKTDSSPVTVNAPAVTPDFSMALGVGSQSTVTIKRGGTGTKLTIDLTPVSAGSTVTINLSNLPKGVSGTFSTNPVTLTTSNVSTILTLKANKTSTPTSTPTTININGTNNYGKSNTLSIPISIY